MEREQIIRDDFPTARKGWSQDAVRAHLAAVAEAFPDPSTQTLPTPAADLTSDRVQSVIAAAESAATEMLSEAQSEADRILGAARAEADRICAARNQSEQKVTAADREAEGRIEQARGAVEGLIAQADKLRSQVGALGRDLASSMPGGSSQADEADPVFAPEPVVVPEAAPEPIRTGVAKPMSMRTPEPEPDAEVEVTAPAISGSDLGAARLVAMNMALDGSSRVQISRQITSEFGEIDNVDVLLDDVLRRANR
jgi:vacuolar-type H+-ATPase subunit H